MIWLGIDTSNQPLSIAIMNDEELLIEQVANVPINHSVRAMSTIEQIFKAIDYTPNQIDAIAVSEGPGSYTGVRIGVTIAKTLAWTLNKPLYGVSSLEVLATSHYSIESKIVCSFIDARRNNVYAGIYKVEKGQVSQVILRDGHYSFKELLDHLAEIESPIWVNSPDYQQYRELISEEQLQKMISLPPMFNVPRASQLIQLARIKGEGSQIHQFVPSYLRVTEAEANLKKK